MARTISWSKFGFICYALSSPQQHNLHMTYLENIDGKEWQLARPQGLTLKPLEESAPLRLTVVQWSNLQTDLAAFDELGNFYILLAGVGLLTGKKKKAANGVSNGGASNGPTNHLKGLNGTSNGKFASAQNGQAKPDESGPSYELTSYNHTEMIFRDLAAGLTLGHGQCVAFKWLGVEKPQILNNPAELSPDKRNYTYGVHQYQPTRLAHPISSKQACVAVRQNGILDFYYQGEHKVEYHKILVNLAADGSQGSVFFSKADIGFSTDKKIVVVAHESGADLIYTYSISVDWGFLAELAVKQRADPHFHTPKDAQRPVKLSCTLLHQMAPLPNTSGELYSQKGYPLQELCNLKLVDILPAYYQGDKDVEVLLCYELYSGDAYSTLIQRFQLKDSADSLVDMFVSMGSGELAERNKMYLWVIQDKFSTPRRLKQVTTAVADSMVLLMYEDGTIDTVDRTSWAVTGVSESPTSEDDMDTKTGELPVRITSVLDAGFRFPAISQNSPFELLVSPNLACFVTRHTETDLDLHLHLLSHPNYATNTHLTAVVVAHAHAHACYGNMSSDDLVTLIRTELNRANNEEAASELADAIITESHRAISFQLNSFTKESVDKLLLNPPLQKLLLLQLAVSEHHTQNRAIRDLAWVVLNLRSTNFSIMFSLLSIYRQISKKKPIEDNLEDSVSRAECIISLVGNVKWLIDLIVYLNQELLQLALTRSRPGDSLITMKNSVALPIIMSKVPRLFLMYALSSIGKTHEILKKLHKDLSESNKLFTPMKEALNRFFGACNVSPLNLSIFESYLREVELTVSKEMAARAQQDSSAPLKLEQQLFCSGKVPETMLSVANVIIDKHAASVNRDYKLSELYFYDNSWIDVGIAVRNLPRPDLHKQKFMPTQIRLQYSRLESVDALRKVIISAASPLLSFDGPAGGKGHESAHQIRKCTRCRAVSLVTDPLVFDTPHTLGLWTMVFQRNCICGSNWVSL